MGCGGDIAARLILYKIRADVQEFRARAHFELRWLDRPLMVLARSASLRSLLPLLATLPRRRPPVRLCASSPSPKHNLLGLSEPELTALVVDNYNQPKFRAKQLHEWMYEKGVTDFDAMANLPKNFRAQLSAEAACGTMEISQERVSGDGTRKRLWRCDDGALIESVLMPYNDGRRTACISSQVGCAMGCTFCATGQMGFGRDLSEGEIFEQAARFALELQAEGERLSNVVFMGMGEPFRNYDAVIGAARRIMGELGVGARHITISTVGIVPNIKRYADEERSGGQPLPELAISLHQSDDASRSAIMPVNRKHDIDELLEACAYYGSKTGRRISFEWALIAGQNDDVPTARRLGERLAAVRGLKCHVNLIPLNPTSGFDGAPTSLPQAAQFVDELARFKVPATVRVRRGIDIEAGCGQLAEAASKEVAAGRLEARRTRTKLPENLRVKGRRAVEGQT